MMVGFTKRKQAGRLLAFCLALLMIGSVLPSIGGRAVVKAAEGSHLLSQGRIAYASSVSGWGYANRAVDGDLNTGWESIWMTDPQWLYIDLGADARITDVTLNWDGGAYAKDFKLQVSSDELNWSDVYTKTDNVPDSSNRNVISLGAVNGRYIRLYCSRRSAENYGYNLKELQVYGTGGADTGVPATENIALNRPVSASSYENKPHITPGTTDPGNVTDGDKNTRWSSDYDENNTANMVNQWISVDLGFRQTIGSVVFYWEGAYGRVYDIQVSDDAVNWTTVFRQLKGRGSMENIPLYTNGRYVRMYGYAKGSAFGYSMYEFEVHAYEEGMQKPVHTIAPLPQKQITQVGEGSYVEDITLMQPREPVYKTDNITTPIPSNKWWTSLLINRWGNALVTLPSKAEYEETGLAVLYAGSGVPTSDGGAVNANGEYDFFVTSNNLNPAKMDALVNDYSDYGVEAVLTDDGTAKMVTNFVKGSPYYYFEFSDRNAAEIYSQHITKLFEDNGNAVLTGDGDTYTGDHIGMEIQNYNENNQLVTRNYGIFAPAGTTFRRVGNKLKIQLGSSQNYMSVGTLPSAGELNYMYQHAYAFVTDTIVEYRVDNSSALVTTTLKSTVELKRPGFSANTLMCLLPHQWKKLAPGVRLTGKTYASIRGTMKVMEGNEFTTTDHFNGIIPQFTEPENGEYSRSNMVTYLRWLETEMDNGYWVADPYWQGKVMHPLATAILACDQIGETELKDKFILILRDILANWLTYSGQGDAPYYMYFSPGWGTINGDGGDHGMAINLSDHHYLWAYFTYAAGVLGSYDQTFVRDYGGMVDLLIRDVGTPDRNDPLFPYLRNFDPYEGHSWAGGYADNNSGANQEAAAECLMAWAGQYLWGVVTGNDAYRDAAIYLYTTESYANKQYWFNMDGDNFPEGYQYGTVGMLFGSSINFGTYFSGEAEKIYGIHWLPTTPHITTYGIDPEKSNRLYQRFLSDLKRKEGRDKENGWYHIIWPFQSMGDAGGALAKWNADAIAADDGKKEVFNTYWFLNSMASAGSRNGDLYCSNWTGYNVFKKDGKYTAMIWNPTDNDFVAEFKSFATGEVVGTVLVPARSTAAGDPAGDAGDIPDPGPGPSAGEKIQAENYVAMSGVEKEACNDVDGGENVGWIDTGDWMEYTVSVEESGTYTMNYRVKGWNVDSAIALKKGSNVLVTANVNTLSEWRTVTSGEFNLTAGTHTIRLAAAGGGFNLNWLQLTKQTGGEVDPPAPGGDVTIRVEAERYAAMNGVANEPCSDADGGENVGYIDAGDWMDYTVAVPSDGTYKAAFRVKGWNSGAKLQLLQDGKELAGISAFNGDVWGTVSSGTFQLKKGTVTLRINITGGGFNLNWMEISTDK